jgi:hypothetical protein
MCCQSGNIWKGMNKYQTANPTLQNTKRRFIIFPDTKIALPAKIADDVKFPHAELTPRLFPV